ncbi:MAG TPA: hypothetical protein VGU68_02980, partial [Ktedonobacteraceae bacterium]|nr:hypothetical protein [Ktedonobacteraceae bacterium]
SNARLLAEGRGIVITPADAREIGVALTSLCTDQALRQRMGLAAREYIATHHSAEMLRNTLLRVTHFLPSLIEQPQ